MKVFDVDYSGRVIQVNIEGELYRIWIRKNKHRYIVDAVFKNDLAVDFVGGEQTDLSISNILKSVWLDIKRLAEKMFSNFNSMVG
ncbi:Cytotoxic translational repressor of toxin-antitoxin stability system [Peptoniphilus sp. ING2-D1G]|nr:Cytotoxic translational repressor of toxin-antitoxin stability system [Peptoniphilus sp. ING2-D1G]